MNLYVTAKRDILVVKTGLPDVQYADFDLWQTPTDITHQIMSTTDKVVAYCDWVLENSVDEDISTVEYDDELEPIRVVESFIYNAGKEHVSEFMSWIEKMDSTGYTIEFSQG